eukprot:6208478-Pleurochrysis_carterae.AAC.1
MARDKGIARVKAALQQKPARSSMLCEPRRRMHARMPYVCMPSLTGRTIATLSASFLPSRIQMPTVASTSRYICVSKSYASGSPQQCMPMGRNAHAAPSRIKSRWHPSHVRGR